MKRRKKQEEEEEEGEAGDEEERLLGCFQIRFETEVQGESVISDLSCKRRKVRREKYLNLVINQSISAKINIPDCSHYHLHIKEHLLNVTAQHFFLSLRCSRFI